VGTFPRRRLQDPGRGCEGQSRAVRSPGRAVRRGTRLTLGPLAEPEQASGRPPEAESLIEPWFAAHARATNRACMRPIGSGAQRERTMRKQTAAPTRKHQQASSIQQPGLIAQGKNAPQSATRRSALDKRSHRTTCASPAGDWPAGGTVSKRGRINSRAQTNGFHSNVDARRVQAPG